MESTNQENNHPSDCEDGLDAAYAAIYDSYITRGIPFACPGDILLMGSGGTMGIINKTYQSLRRPEIDSSLIKYTHIGIVTHIGMVAHSIPHKGALLKEIAKNDPQFGGMIKSGITLDIIQDSGFLDECNKEILVLRNKSIYENPKKQRAITSAAMYFLGAQYNFLIDFKNCIINNDNDAHLQHCSEFVDRVLVKANIKQENLNSSKALPIDNLINFLTEENQWDDITQIYKAGNFLKIDREEAKLTFKLQLLLTASIIQSAQTAKEVNKVTSKLSKLLNEVINNPSAYKEDLATIKETTPEILLKDYITQTKTNLLHKKEPLEALHLADQAKEIFLNNTHKYGREIIELNFTLAINAAIMWYESAKELVDEISSEKASFNLQKIDMISYRMRLISDSFNVKINIDSDEADGTNAALSYIKSIATTIQSNPNNLDILLHQLSTAIFRSKVLENLSITDNQSIEIARELLRKENIESPLVDLKENTCIQLGDINEKIGIRYRIDFEKLLTQI